MAEELGHIDIRFPNVPGGGAGDATGPIPSKQKAGASVNVGALVASSVASFAAGALSVVTTIGSMLKNVFSGLVDYIESGVASILEKGQMSPQVMQEAIGLKMQTFQQQLQQTQVLGPLYASVIKWYRELMALLQPWRNLFSAISSFLLGALLQTLVKIMEYLNVGLEYLLAQLSDFANIVAKGFDVLSSKENIAIGTAAVVGGVTGNVGMGFAVAEELADFLPTEGIAEIAGGLSGLAKDFKAAIDELRDINKNTKKKSTGGTDWARAQLVQLAATSQFYAAARARNTFYTP